VVVKNSKLIDYLSFRCYLIHLKDWDKWQFGIRSKNLKNPLTNDLEYGKKKKIL